MSFFGLDIGSYSIKFVKADGHGAKAHIKTIGSVYNSVGQVLPSDGHAQEQLAVLIKNGMKDFGLTGMNCNLSLPSSQSYISIVNMPSLTNTELASAIQWEAEQDIPVNIDELNFEYDVIYRPEKTGGEHQMSVFMVGVPKTVVNKYLNLLEIAGVEPIGLEPDVLALMRPFVNENTISEYPGASLICNFGAINSNFVVIDDGILKATYSASVGSLALTRALEKGLNLDPQRSEEYKRTYGLMPDQFEGKVRNTLQPVFETLIREIKKTMQYYMSQSSSHKQISRVIMVGGGSGLPDMVSYLVKQLSAEVIIGNPITAYQVDKKMEIPEDAHTYSIAAGLATKEF